MDRRDLETWQPQAPDDDFAQQVVAEALAEERRQKRRFVAPLGGLLAVAAMVAIWFVTRPAEMGSGSLVAEARTERALGDVARLVAEPGAELRWSDRRVSQERGDVFYRVDEAPFEVVTPAGTVKVTGTCFVVKTKPGEAAMKKRDLVAAGAGAALAAITVVTVYEGTVHLSHAGEEVAVAAGESATVDGEGVRKVEGEALADAEDALQKKAAHAEARGDALADGVAKLRAKVAGLQQQKQKLEGELKDAQTRLDAAAKGDPDALKHPYDLDQEDWAELAKDGTIKFSTPCHNPNWRPSPASAEEAGLDGEEVDALVEAHHASQERMWSALRPLCVDAIGNEDVADLLGAGTCTHIIVDVARQQDSAAAYEAMRQVGEMRAGQRPMPGADEEVHPTVATFLALTGENERFLADLTETFGPDEARQLVFEGPGCMSKSTFGGPGPRKE